MSEDAETIEYYCSLPWAGFPFRVRDGVVSEAPACRTDNETVLKTAGWMVGKDIAYVAHWIEDNRGEVTFQ